MAQTFSFPILSDAELLPCLKDMELPLNATGLAKPTPELVRPVYESVVTTLVGVTRSASAPAPHWVLCYGVQIAGMLVTLRLPQGSLRGSAALFSSRAPLLHTATTLRLGHCREELQQPVFTAIDALEYPELHDESIPFMAFLKQLTKLMSAAGVRDFTMQARSLAQGVHRGAAVCRPSLLRTAALPQAEGAAAGYLQAGLGALAAQPERGHQLCKVPGGEARALHGDAGGRRGAAGGVGGLGAAEAAPGLRSALLSLPCSNACTAASLQAASERSGQESFGWGVGD